MARPTKTGLDYFPLDVDMDQDDKLFFIEAKYGLISFAIIVRILMLIYKDGYYKYYSEDKEAFMLAKRLSVDVNVLKNVINDCINDGIFNKNLFERYGILTSRGIQKRYLEACSRRKEVSIIKEYCLVNTKKYKNIVFEHLNRVNVDNNPSFYLPHFGKRMNFPATKTALPDGFRLYHTTMQGTLNPANFLPILILWPPYAPIPA